MRIARLLLFASLACITATVAAAQARISRIEFRPATVEEGGGIHIALLGSGRCTYTIDYGDGQSEKRTDDLPAHLQHKYAAGKAYDVVATPDAPCEGVARARLDIQAIERGIWKIHVELASATAPEIVVLIDGTGTCAVTVDFGDGQKEKHDVTLPAKVPHKYLKAGAYDIVATTHAPCSGEGRARIDIKR